MLEELLKAFHSQVKERLISPLMGAFAISWILWNYRFLIILLSEEPVRQSFQMINELVYPDFWAVVWRGLLVPLGTALLYIFVYPYPAKFVYEFTRKRQRELLEVQRKIEDETPLTIEESRKVRRELYRLESSYEEQIERKDREIERLRMDIETLRKDLLAAQQHVVPEVSKKSQPKNDSAGGITARQKEILEAIGKSDGARPEANLIRSGKNKIQDEFELGELKRKKLISSDFRSGVEGYGVYVSLTHEGRRVLVESGYAHKPA